MDLGILTKFWRRMDTKISDQPKGPREMVNNFIDTACDWCGVKFGNRPNVWVCNEHICCSRSCVVKAQERTDRQSDLDDL
jgi:hypothetical protein